MTFLRALMLLALVVWIGGIIFFAFVLAPTVFTVLPTTAMAGNVVSRSLTILHWMGIGSAFVFLICSLLYNRAKYSRLKMFTMLHVLVVIMLILTLVSQFAITPRMQVLRAHLQPLDDIAHKAFFRLHYWSTGLEGGVLFLGLAALFLTARRFS